MKRNPMCNGCRFQNDAGRCGCGVKPKNEGSLCPCISCLVKVTCNVTCDDWSDYEFFVNKGLGHLNLSKDEI